MSRWIPAYISLSTSFLLLMLLAAGCGAVPEHAPRAAEGVVHFTAEFAEADSVFLAGDFNGWEPRALPMQRGPEGLWRAELPLSVGYHEYKFVVGDSWHADPNNPATTINNHGEPNSVFFLSPTGEVELRGYRAGEQAGTMPAGEGTVYLALIWHQHQPFYLDAEADALVAPWVRTHTTKDYYDMTAMLAETPDIHVAMNLTPVLLHQLEYYVDRIGPFFDERSQMIRADAFLREWAGRTDPWVDLLLSNTAALSEEQEQYLYRNEWSCFSISHVLMDRWPRYVAIKEAFDALGPEALTLQDKRDLKALFYLANFDPRFLEGPVELVTGRSVDLSDIVLVEPGPVYRLKQPIRERDANRILAETWKVAEAVIPLHRQMNYNPLERTGQVEVVTTPYFHPILPLIIDAAAGRSKSDQAPEGLDFAHPGDAWLHVEKAQQAYREWFGRDPLGMWPAEGSVSPAAVDLFAKAGVDWIATGDGVLAKSKPAGLEATTPYLASGPGGGRVAVFFRDTELSDLIGFRYQRWEPEEAADDLIGRILATAPKEKGESRLLTILLDGENAWEWYERDADAIRFLSLVYQKLAEEQAAGRIITVTPGEYLYGNEARGVPAHSLEELPELEQLWPGSWIRADFSTWIGEEEENRGWRWLQRTRDDFQRLVGEDYQPLPASPADRSAHHELVHEAWMSLLAAEGSDWFWWYGDDQNTGEGDLRWDQLYRKHLRHVYQTLEKAGYDVTLPEIPQLIEEPGSGGGGGTMSEGE